MNYDFCELIIVTILSFSCTIVHVLSFPSLLTIQFSENLTLNCYCGTF